MIQQTSDFFQSLELSHCSLAFQLIHATFAFFQLFNLYRTWRTLARITPFPSAYYGLMIMFGGLAYDNFIRTLSPMLEKYDPLHHPDFAAWIRRLTCISYLLRSTTISSLFAVAYQITDRLYPPSVITEKKTKSSKGEWWKDLKTFMYGAALLCFIWGLIDYYWITRPCSFMHLTKQFGVPLYRFQESRTFFTRAPIAMMFGAGLLYTILGFLTMMEKGKVRPLFLMVHATVLLILFTPAPIDSPETLVNFVRFIAPSAVEILFASGVYYTVSIANERSEDPDEEFLFYQKLSTV